MSERVRREALPGWMQLALAALVAYRIVYHSAYVQRVPFALTTFSDGRQYELAALDILSSPPLGTEPFYLQGLYAYFMAVPMAIKPWVSLAALLQLVVAGLAAWGFFRATATWLGRRGAGWASMLLLAYPGLAFYENKFLTAALAVATLVLLLLAMARVQGSPSPRRHAVVGAALGLCMLARPNMVLAVPFVLWAVALVVPSTLRARGQAIGVTLLGMMLVLTPMAVRNGLVTGSATVFPAHGGGTSFYIGNNRHARGVWNDAGGLLSGEVAHERSELVRRLEIEASSRAGESEAVGRALYRRAFSEIAEDPGRWAWLLVRKGWLVIGNDELTQDYDWLGEQEMLPWAHRIPVPFGVLLALALVGALRLRQRSRVRDEDRGPDPRPLAWVVVGIVVAVFGANLLYFTSSQHRLPLVVPLAVLAGLGAPASIEAIGDLVRARRVRQSCMLVGSLLLVGGLAAVPRMKHREISAVHDYNLAVAWIELGQPDLALAAFDRAVERRPDHVLFRLERASLRRLRGDYEGARADLQALEANALLPEQPAWVRGRVAIERRAVGLPHDRLQISGARGR